MSWGGEQVWENLATRGIIAMPGQILTESGSAGIAPLRGCMVGSWAGSETGSGSLMSLTLTLMPHQTLLSGCPSLRTYLNDSCPSFSSFCKNSSRAVYAPAAGSTSAAGDAGCSASSGCPPSGGLPSAAGCPAVAAAASAAADGATPSPGSAAVTAIAARHVRVVLRPMYQTNMCQQNLFCPQKCPPARPAKDRHLQSYADRGAGCAAVLAKTPLTLHKCNSEHLRRCPAVLSDVLPLVCRSPSAVHWHGVSLRVCSEERPGLLRPSPRPRERLSPAFRQVCSVLGWRPRRHVTASHWRAGWRPALVSQMHPAPDNQAPT